MVTPNTVVTAPTAAGTTGDLTGSAVIFDAPHSAKANSSRMVETKKAHHSTAIKTYQPAAYAQLAALPRQSIAKHTAPEGGHGLHASRLIKTCRIADELGGFVFPMPA